MDDIEKAKSLFYQKLAKAEREANLNFEDPNLDFMMFVDEYQKDVEKVNQEQKNSELLTGYIKPVVNLSELDMIYSGSSMDIIARDRGAQERFRVSNVS